MKDINYILEMIPHRYPFLLVDRIIDKKDKKEIKTLKNVTINEPFFSGHFPNKPITVSYTHLTLPTTMWV